MDRRGALKGEALEGRSDLGTARGGEQTPPPPAKSTATYLGIPQHTQSPFLLLLFRLGKLARLRQGPQVAAAGRRQPPLGVPPSLRPAQQTPQWRQRQQPLLWLRALRPLFPVSSARPVPLRWDSCPSASLSPFHHSCTPETLLALWRLFIISGSERPRTLGSLPRGWGRCDPGSASRCLAQGSVWVRRPKPDSVGAGRGGVGVSSRGRRQLAIPLAAPHSESHPIPLPLLPEPH